MKCKTCGKNSDNEFCFKCKPRKPLSSGKGFSSKKSSFLTKKQDKSSDNLLEMRKLFLDIWNIRPHRSEVSDEYLGSEAMSTYFHHILPKSKYPEACLDAENIVLLSLLEHANVENDMYRYEEVNRRREQLKIKYNL
jgi:hypothetical protein